MTFKLTGFHGVLLLFGVIMSSASLIHLISLSNISAQMVTLSNLMVLHHLSVPTQNNDHFFEKEEQFSSGNVDSSSSSDLDDLSALFLRQSAAVSGAQQNVSLFVIVSVLLLLFVCFLVIFFPPPVPQAPPVPSELSVERSAPQISRKQPKPKAQKKKEEDKEEEKEEEKKEGEEGKEEKKEEKEEEKKEEGGGEEEGEIGGEDEEEEISNFDGLLPHMTPRPKHPLEIESKEKFEKVADKVCGVSTKELHNIMYSDSAQFPLTDIIEVCGEFDLEMANWKADDSKGTDKLYFTRDVISRKNIPPNPFGPSVTRVHRHQFITASLDWSSFECRTTSASVEAPFSNDFVCEEHVLVKSSGSGCSISVQGRVVFWKKPWMVEGRIRSAALDGMREAMKEWLTQAGPSLQA